jgi:hypothetical protein
MEAARDLKDASDLFHRLQEIKLVEVDLNFGPRTFEFTPDADGLGMYIRENLFPEIDVWPAQCTMKI